MPWRGYNFEDAILISEKLVREDYYTSSTSRNSRLRRGTQSWDPRDTRDIPNVSEHALRDLDESGVIRIGAQIKHGDILVGKVTPRRDTAYAGREIAARDLRRKGRGCARRIADLPSGIEARWSMCASQPQGAGEG